MGRILFLVNHDVVIYNFRLELVEELLANGHNVIISSPYGERIEKLKKLGCEYYEIKFVRHGRNPIKEIKLLFTYWKLLRQIRPDTVLTYTIKPNIYGGLASRMLHIPYIANITGLGTAMEHPGILRLLITRLYRMALKKASCVFCQNKENLKFIKNNRMVSGKLRLLPGSGVNLKRFSLEEYPPDGEIKFVFVSRIMKEKGIGEYLEAAKKIKKDAPKTQFHICGFCEEGYEPLLETMQKKGVVEYHGMVSEIRDVLRDMHCVILPSYHEGMSNALLEAAATGRPLIASDIPGCRECLKDGKTGFLITPGSAGDLAEKIREFLALPYQQKQKMGAESRTWVETRFDRERVVDAYLEEIQRGDVS